MAGARRGGGPPVGGILQPLPRSYAERLLLQQGGGGGSAVSGKQGCGRMEGLRPEGLGGDRRTHEERLQGTGRGSQAVDGVVKSELRSDGRLPTAGCHPAPQTTTPRCRWWQRGVVG